MAKKNKPGMIDFGDLEKNDAHKRKALKKIIRALSPLLPGDYILQDIVNIAKEGLKERE